MKCVILLLVFCFVHISADPYISNYRVVTVERKSDVNKDIQEFINLFPRNEITLIVKDYIDNDIEVGRNWKYLNSPFVREQIERIEKSPEFQKVIRHLEQTGLDIPKFLMQLHHLLSPLPPPSPVSRGGPGLHGLLLESIKPLVPMSKLKLLATQKYVFSSAFRGLVKTITSKAFKTDIQALVTSREVKILENDAERNGVDVKAVYEFVASFQFLYEYLMDL